MTYFEAMVIVTRVKEAQFQSRSPIQMVASRLESYLFDHPNTNKSQIFEMISEIAKDLAEGITD